MRVSVTSIFMAFPLCTWAAIPTSNTVLNGTYALDGGGSTIDATTLTSLTGYFMQSGTLDFSNVTLTNFQTTGGAGSGGGAGFGGALFINNGVTVSLNNVNFLANTAIGGTGGHGDQGGVLNGFLTPTSSGTPGFVGEDSPDSPILFSYLDFGNGGPGLIGGLGGNGSQGFGGDGGKGGNGAPGLPTSLQQDQAVADQLALIKKTADDDSTTASLTATNATYEGLIGDVASGAADPLVDLLTPWPEQVVAAFEGSFAFNDELVAYVGSNITVYDAFRLSLETAFVTYTQVSAYLVTGSSGMGGNGGLGGAGGDGSFGFGGGRGGDGGAGADAVSGSVAIGGLGGTGGVGGVGGFGGGGGRGGDLAVSGANGTFDFVANGPLIGAIAPGGIGGFGGGIGSAGSGQTEYSSDMIGAGGGGWGCGGAIFVVAGGVLNINGPATFCGNAAQGGRSLNNGVGGLDIGSDLFMMTGSTVTLNPGLGNTILFNGTIADDSIASDPILSIPNGAGAGLSLLSGLAILNGLNTYSGPTVVSGGAVLQAIDGIGVNRSSNITLGGGLFQGSGSFARYLGTQFGRLQFTGPSSGFSSAGGDLTVAINCGGTLTWGQPSFISSGSALLFGSTSATNDVIFTNPIDLAGTTQTILATANAGNTNEAILTGVLSDGSLTVGDPTHTGTVVLAAANTYLGPTEVAGGSVILTGSLQSSSILIDTGATFEDVNAGLLLTPSVTANGTFILDMNDAIDALTGSGTVNLLGGSLTVNSGTFSGSITGTNPAYGIIKVSGGTLALSGNSTYIGPTQLSAGTITLTGTLLSPIINIAAGTTFNDNTSPTGGLAAANAIVTVDGAFVLGPSVVTESIDTLLGSTTGTVDLNSAALSINQGTFAGVISGNASSQLIKNSLGTLTLSGASTYTGSTQINAGTLTLTGSLASATVNVALGATLNDNSGGLSSGATLTNSGLVNLPVNNTIMALINSGTINGTGTLTALTYTLNDGSLINANLGTGTLTTTAGVETLTGTSAASIVTVNAASTFNLVGNQRLSSGANVTLNGTLSLPTFAQTINTLNGTGGTLLADTFQVNNGGLISSGTITTTTLFTVGGGTLNLNNTNFTTPTLILDPLGTLNVSGAATIFSANTVTLSNNSTFSVTNNAIVHNPSTIDIPGFALLNVTTGGQFIGGNILLESNGNINLDTTGLINVGTITTGLNSTITVPDSSRLIYTLLTGFGFVNSLGNTFVNNATVSGYMQFSNGFTNLGTLSPGFSPGLIIIGGNYTEGGHLDLDLVTTTAVTGYDQVRVGGTATLLPTSVFDVDMSSAVNVPGNFFQVIANSTGGPIHVGGTLGGITLTLDSAPVSPNSLLFDSATGRLYITALTPVTPVVPTPPGTNPRQAFYNLGCSTDQHHAAKGIFKVALITPIQIDTDTIAGQLGLQVLQGNPCEVLQFYTPTYYGGMADYAFMGDRALASKVWDRVSVFSSLPDQCCPRVSAFGGYLDSRENDIHKCKLMRHDTYGGMDYSTCRGFSIGAAVADSRGKIKSFMGRSKVEGNTGIAYVRKNLGTYVTLYGTASGSIQDNHLHRPTQNGHVTTRSRTKSITGNLGAQVTGWTFNHFSIGPRCNVVYSQAHVAGFTEKGAIDALHDSGFTAKFLTGELGLSVLYSIQRFGLEAIVGVEQPFIYHKSKMDMYVVSSPDIAYPLYFSNNGKTRVSGGLNLGYSIYKFLTVYGSYEAISGGNWDHRANAGIRICL